MCTNIVRSFSRVRWFTAAVITAAFIAAQFIPFSAKAGGVNVWWPANDASVSGIQPFKAMLDTTREEV